LPDLRVGPGIDSGDEAVFSASGNAHAPGGTESPRGRFGSEELIAGPRIVRAWRPIARRGRLGDIGVAPHGRKHAAALESLNWLGALWSRGISRGNGLHSGRLLARLLRYGLSSSGSRGPVTRSRMYTHPCLEWAAIAFRVAPL
jgi:hypothetical protein